MKTKRVTDILGPSNVFLDILFKRIAQKGIEVSNFELDHICYRVETQEKYESLKQELSSIGELLTESLIGGRKIATFKLLKPITYLDRQIYLIELPSPKKSSWYREGYEHAEFVIESSLEEFQERNKHIEFDTKGIEKSINPDIRLPLGDINAKFHLHNLEYVIKELD